MPLSMFTLRHKPLQHTLCPPLQMSENIDLFFYIFLLPCQSKSVLIEWPSRSYPLYLCGRLKAKPAAVMWLGFHFLSKH